MLEAQIDIVDSSGHTEESVRVLGAADVSVGPRTGGRFLHADADAASNVATIRVGRASAAIMARFDKALQRHGEYFPVSEPIELEPGAKFVEVFSERIGRFIRVTMIQVPGEQLGEGGVVIRSRQPSSLVSRAQAAAARGAIEVSAQLKRLLEQGKIDERGNVLVPWPDDMKPDSQTDL